MPAELPENLELWPSDPRMLLGLTPDDADPMAAKRSYIRKIKRFKPEQFPEHFRRLRDAYEEVVSQMARDAFLKQIQGDAPAENMPGTAPQDGNGASAGSDGSTTVAAEAQADGAQGSYPIVREAPFVPSSPVDAAWLQAIEGDEAWAYRDLKGLAADPERAGDAPLRLYWLLSVRPELDSQKHRCDWLLEAFRREKLVGPALELYRRELERPGEEIESGRSEAALKMELPSYALYHLALSRWQALGARGAWKEILSDFPRLRKKFQFDDEVSWGRLLLAAADLALWRDAGAAEDVVRICDAEVDSLHHLHVPLREHLERFDLVRDTVEGWRQLSRQGRVPEPWLQLIHYGWTETIDRIYPIAAQVAANIAADPEGTLTLIPILRAPMSTALMQLAKELRHYGYRFGPAYAAERDEAHVKPLVEAFCAKMRWLTYDVVRPEILHFCMRELVSPDYVAQIADVVQPAVYTHEGDPLADLIRIDVMLDVAYAGWRAING